MRSLAGSGCLKYEFISRWAGETSHGQINRCFSFRSILGFWNISMGSIIKQHCIKSYSVCFGLIYRENSFSICWNWFACDDMNGSSQRFCGFVRNGLVRNDHLFSADCSVWSNSARCRRILQRQDQGPQVKIKAPIWWLQTKLMTTLFVKWFFGQRQAGETVWVL